MEPTKFTVLVNDLLEPKLKKYMEVRLKQPSSLMPGSYRNDSIALRAKEKRMPCGDCGDMVSGRVIEYVIYSMGTKNQHWKKCCNICKAKTKMENGLKDIEK